MKTRVRPVPTGCARVLYLASTIALLPGLLIPNPAVLQMGLGGLFMYFISRWMARRSVT